MSILNRFGDGVRRAIVVVAFIGIPLAVWWAAMPMIGSLPLSEGIRRLLTWAVLGTMAFGAAGGVLVWRDLDREP
ncbi:MAG: hypothetical protein H6737_27225 [Alphaproteobacteria bacterium]|nr:hypothetical protein [Alphaproteobacteria bacterium]